MRAREGFCRSVRLPAARPVDMCAFQWSSECLILRVEEVSTCVDLPPERLPGEPNLGWAARQRWPCISCPRLKGKWNIAAQPCQYKIRTRCYRANQIHHCQVGQPHNTSARIHTKAASMLSHDQLQRYLEHVQLSEADLTPSLATLTAVHRQHMQCIPFANVTVARVPEQLLSLDFPKASPDTSTDGIFTKLIDRKWGGYCFESNNLLSKALATLGFDLYCVAGRNLIGPPTWKPNPQLIPNGFGHQVVLATVPEVPDVWYVVDSAFGSPTPLEPVALRESSEEAGATGASHRVRRGFIGRPGSPSAHDLAARPQECGWYMQRWSETDTEWLDLYVFNEKNLSLQNDFNMMNFYVANCATSMFQKNLMISIRTDEGGHGRNTLVNTTLKVFDKAGGILEERELNTAEDLRAALESYFGIVPLTS